MKDINDEVLSHINRNWPDCDKESFTWELGKIKQQIPCFSVVRVAPRESGDPWVYISKGAWKVDTGNVRYEFLITSPYETPIHVESLAMFSSYLFSNKSDVYIGKSINIGRGWLDDSGLDHFLVSLPYPYGEKLEYCHIDGDLTIRFLWLLPIYSNEKSLLMSDGLEALENKFDERGINYLDPCRPSVV